MRKNNVNISFYLIQTFGGNIWPSNYCWSHHKVGHFCPKMRLKETGRNLGRIWQMKFHLQARFSIEIHFYFQTLRLKNSTFCLFLRKSKKNCPRSALLTLDFRTIIYFFFQKSLKEVFNMLWYGCFFTNVLTVFKHKVIFFWISNVSK